MNRAAAAKRIAFFGGSFDPPHIGHLAVARAARTVLQLDSVLFVPVGSQPLKPAGATASFADRVEMTRLAIQEERGFEVSLADSAGAEEAAAGRPNYTIETLERLRGTLPGASTLFLLMGADSYFSLRQWYRAADLPFAAELIVASRPGQPIADLQRALPCGLTLKTAGENRVSSGSVRSFTIADASGRMSRLHVLPGLHVDVSASVIRSQGMAVFDLLPEPVMDYILEHGLYGCTSGRLQGEAKT